MEVVELEFNSLRVGEITSTKPSYILVFKDLDSEVYLGIWIGARENRAIMSLLSGRSVLFSATSMRFKNFILLLKLLGVVATRVVITHLDKDIFRAKGIFITGKRAEDIQISLEGRFADLMFLTLLFKPRYFVNLETMKSVGTILAPEIDVMAVEEKTLKASDYREILSENVVQYYPVNSGLYFNIPQSASMQKILVTLLKNKLLRN